MMCSQAVGRHCFVHYSAPFVATTDRRGLVELVLVLAVHSFHFIVRGYHSIAAEMYDKAQVFCLACLHAVCCAQLSICSAVHVGTVSSAESLGQTALGCL